VPSVRLDKQMMEIRDLTGNTMKEIRKDALVEYIANFSYKEHRLQKLKQRRSLIRYAVKKHGKEAARVLSKMGTPVKIRESDFYKQCLMDRRHDRRVNNEKGK